MDLYFVLDGSDSISYPDFGYLKQAMASLVPQIRLGEKPSQNWNAGLQFRRSGRQRAFVFCGYELSVACSYNT